MTSQPGRGSPSSARTGPENRPYFKALVGLLPVSQGRVLIHRRSLQDPYTCIAYVPQREEVDWRFPVTVGDVVMMGRYGRMGRFQRPGKADQEAVASGLEQMGIAGLVKHPIGDLSGGQQQRVFLARALAQEPHILLMDEPFTGVDVTTQDATLDLLEQLHEQQVTVMVSTHDLRLAGEQFELVLLLNHRLVGFGPPERMFTGKPASCLRRAGTGAARRARNRPVLPPDEVEDRNHP